MATWREKKCYQCPHEIASSKLTTVPLRATFAPALRTLASTTLPKLPSPISFKTSNRSSNAKLLVLCDEDPRRATSWCATPTTTVILDAEWDNKPIEDERVERSEGINGSERVSRIGPLCSWARQTRCRTKPKLSLRALSKSLTSALLDHSVGPSVYQSKFGNQERGRICDIDASVCVAKVGGFV